MAISTGSRAPRDEAAKTTLLPFILFSCTQSQAVAFNQPRGVSECLMEPPPPRVITTTHNRHASMWHTSGKMRTVGVLFIATFSHSPKRRSKDGGTGPRPGGAEEGAAVLLQHLPDGRPQRDGLRVAATNSLCDAGEFFPGPNTPTHFCF